MGEAGGRAGVMLHASASVTTRALRRWLTACVALLLGAMVWPLAPASATVPVITPTVVQILSTSTFSPSAPDPAGIAYIPATDRFLISDSEVEEMGIYQGINLWSATRSGAGSGVGTTYAFAKEPSGIGYDSVTNTLYVADDDSDKVTIDHTGGDGTFGTADDVWVRFSTSAFGSTDPEGVEFDIATGHLFVCDGTGLEVYEVDPANGVFGDGNDVVTHFDLEQYAARDCEGIGIDAQAGTLLVVDPSRRKLYELSKAGVLLNIIDLNVIPTSNRNFASVTRAPTSDPTDSPANMSYWVVDRGVDNGADPNENDGRLYELYVPPTGPPVDAAPTVSITSPAEGAAVRGTVTVQASATDDNGVANVLFAVDGSPIGADSDGTDGWSVAWDSSAAAQGAHTLSATATDTAGHSTTDTSAVQVDNVAPTVSVTLPGEGAIVSGVVPFAASASDDPAVTSVAFRVDGALVSTDSSAGDGWSASWASASVANGSHAVTAVAMDAAGNSTTSPAVSVTVDNPPVLDIPVSSAIDDADEVPDGTVRRNNGDLELGTDQGGLLTTAGVRFTGVQVPAGATIVNAYIQFTADEKNRKPADLLIRAEATDDAQPFTAALYNLSSRIRTAAVAWSPPQWLVLEAAGPNERTPNLSALLQELVDRPGWASGNAVAFLISGTGRRTAETVDGGFAPSLHIEFSTS